jgi:hypothetical protein
LTKNFATGYWSDVTFDFMGRIDDNAEEEKLSVSMNFLLAFGAFNVTGTQGFMPMVQTEYTGVMDLTNPRFTHNW